VRPETRIRHDRGVIPDFVTHYYLANRGPFLNLSELDEPTLMEVMVELIRQRNESRQHRLFGRTYIAMRRLVEARLYQLFAQAGGRPERKSPHYFILGESPWFRGLAVNMQELRLPLTALPYDQTSLHHRCSSLPGERRQVYGARSRNFRGSPVC